MSEPSTLRSRPSQGDAASRPDGKGRRRRSRWRRALRLVLVLLLLLVAGGVALYASTPDVGHLAEGRVTATAYMALRRSEAAEEGRRLEIRQTWVPLEATAPVLRQALVLAEDRRFYRHGGVDAKAIRRVVRETVEEGKPLAGASTITQQLARNLYLSPARSPIRKLREAVIAWRLEAALDKDRILELYLNVVEWGDGIFGVEEAARRYYGVSSASLTPAQAARLVVALPNPRARSPAIDRPDLVHDAACLIARLCLRGEIPLAAREAAFEELGVTDATRPPSYMLLVPEP